MIERRARQRAAGAAELGAAGRAGARHEVALQLGLAGGQLGGEAARFLGHGLDRAAIDHLALQRFPVDQADQDARAVVAPGPEVRGRDRLVGERAFDLGAVGLEIGRAADRGGGEARRGAVEQAVEP